MPPEQLNIPSAQRMSDTLQLVGAVIG